jgi:hypothetical protein
VCARAHSRAPSPQSLKSKAAPSLKATDAAATPADAAASAAAVDRAELQAKVVELQKVRYPLPHLTA